MMKRVIGFVLMWCCVSVQANPSQNLSELLQQIWQFELVANPINATSYGQHQYDALLPDISASGLAKNNQQRQAFVAELNKFSDADLSQQQQINKAFQLRELQNAIDEYRYHAHYMPLTSESGFHSSLAFLPQSTRFKNVADYQNYLSRLSQFPDWFSQQIHWMQQGMQVGLTQPKAVLKDYEKGVKAFITATPEQSVYYRPFAQFDAKSFDKTTVQKLQKQARDVIQNKVFVAYQNYYDFLRRDYIPAARDSIAAKDWPDGEAFYQNRTAFYTTTAMTPAQIHQLGLSEVKRIRGEMQAIIDKLQFDGDLADFIHYLRTDPRFYAKTADELMAKAAVIAKTLDAKLPSLFGKLPRRPYGVVPVPDSIAPKYTTGRYIPAAKDDEPGYYWVNTYALDKRPLYALTALTMHEAVPGHHLQISLSQEMTDLPEVRRNGYISAFGEGWGLYAEYLGKEAGMYQNPYDDFGRLSYEMWRACRLVVDTGMHLMGWSRQQAVDYMLANTALSEHNINTEVDRYISWPAQALSYKIGELTIKRLRKQAEQQLGNKFDLRAFHDAVLANGSVPLNVLEQQIERFIAQTKSN
ncbi:DUF885 domain-containing protein [Neptunicella marina]|uniref:DUF885 domain-containing protein n=1 Tax=Neptunicella marina TaxID=2125989 RepID=A0A8J6IUJ2_9ALTE|nr:DUF885 domain-containing protein [Neptunicella marina]MBC3765881.1 DUF885 domain-containing protein [Neptunicella marina]